MLKAAASIATRASAVAPAGTPCRASHRTIGIRVMANRKPRAIGRKKSGRSRGTP
jgi:hypothetical protein